MGRAGVLWGLDPFATQLAAGLCERGRQSERVTTLFDPTRDWRADLTAALVPLAEEARAQGVDAPLSVVVLASIASAQPSTVREAIRTVDGVLDTCPPGRHAVQLVLFLPTLTATAEDKIRAFDFLVALEQWDDRLDFLSKILLFPSNLYSDDVAAGGAPIASGELLDLLDRALWDTAVERGVDGVAGLGFGTGPFAAGRRSWYSTIGQHRLVHPAEACFEYLRARFVDELFHKGFYDTTTAPERDTRAIQGQADDLVARTLATIETQLGRLQPFSVGASDASASSHATEWLDNYRKEVRAAHASGEAASSGVCESLAGWPKTDLLEVLQTGPCLLAGGRWFLDALLDRRLDADEEDADAPPGGVAQLERSLRRNPLVRVAERILASAAGAVAADLGARDGFRGRDEPVFAWLERMVRSLHKLINEQSPGRRSWMRFCLHASAAVMKRLGESRCDAAYARELPGELATSFSGDWERLEKAPEELERQRARLEEQRARLVHWPRWVAALLTGRQRFLARLKAVERELAQVNLQIEDVTTSLGRMRRLLLDITNEVALPLFLRALVADAARREAANSAADFASFVDVIDRAVRLARENATIPPAPDRSATTVATPNRLDLLYESVIGRRGMPALARAVLEFSERCCRTPGLIGRRPSYRHCQNLADHYENGPETLLDRMVDYSRDVFYPVRSLGVLDLLEMEGHEAARQALEHALGRSAPAVDFSPTLVPAINARGTKPAHVVWVDGGAASGLARAYRDVFAPDCAFINSTDSCSIGIVSLCLGFPAFAVHLLEECRQLARGAAPPGELDLWPR